MNEGPNVDERGRNEEQKVPVAKDRANLDAERLHPPHDVDAQVAAWKLLLGRRLAGA